MTQTIETNKLILVGQILNEPVFYHVAYEENFYSFNIQIPRLSDTFDVLPVLVSEKLLSDLDVGNYIKIEGQLRTYNKAENNKTKLLQFAFVKQIEHLSEEVYKTCEVHNEVVLTGFICKEPTYRKTLTQRQISDILIAVNRAYKQSDYIPVIAWGRNAVFCSTLKVGQQVEIIGRMQSREYTKKVGEVTEVKIAYEISANNIKVIDATNTEEK